MLLSLTDSQSNELVSLESWREIVSGIDPWQFWGFSCQRCNCNDGQSCKTCKRVWRKYALNGRLGRDEIVKALNMAADAINNHLNVPVGLHWFSETIDMPPLLGTVKTASFSQGWCDYPTVQLCRDYVKDLGVRSESLVGAVSLVLTDADGNDPFVGTTKPRTFTATIPYSGDPLDTSCLQLHFADREDNCDIGYHSYIQTTKITYDTILEEYTVIGRAWNVGNPLHWLGSDCVLDCLAQASYASNVELWHIGNKSDGLTTDDSQALILHRAKPCGCARCGCEINGPSSQNNSIAKGGLECGEIGRVFLDYVDDEGNKICCPDCYGDKATVRYAAGVTGDDACYSGLATAVSKIAVGLLPELCQDCCVDESWFKKWTYDLSEQSDSETILGRNFSIPFGQMSNPLRIYTRGVVEGWQDAQPLARQRATAL